MNSRQKGEQENLVPSCNTVRAWAVATGDL